MFRLSPITVQEIERMERTMKFLYFLRDIGIDSSVEPAREAFTAYMELLAELGQNR